MLQKTHALAIGLMLVAFVAAPAVADSYEMQEGTPDIKSVGPLAFGEAGILFIGDPLGAAVFAIDTKDTAGLEYETIDEVEGVVQLDHLNAENALALINTESGMDLRTLPLP
jgi:hypothetical protein